MAEDCIFCKIVNKEIPANIVYENNKEIAFLDIRPINKGHLLIIPKEHYENFLLTPDNTLKDVVILAKKLAKIIKKVTKADGINIGINNYSAAGQEVMHMHMHIIPRFSDDGLKHWPGKSYEEGEMERLAEQISSVL